MRNENSSTEVTRPLFVRRRVNRRILHFSLSIGLVGVALATVAYFVPGMSKFQEAQSINQRALSQIDCTGSECDSSRYTTSSWLEGPDYFIDMETRYFVDVPSADRESATRFPPLDFADTAFIRGFRQPETYTTPDGEIWRLYSQGASSGDLNVEIILGYAQKAPWRILTASAAEVRNIDAELRREAELMAGNLSAMVHGSGSGQRLAADGFAIVDSKTGEIVRFGPWVPMFLRKDTKFPVRGRKLYVGDGQLYVVQVHDNGRFTTVSLISLGDLWSFGVLAILVFIIASAITRTLSRRFLRNYFAMTSIRTPSLDEACRSGEGQEIEFKRGFSEDETKTSISETSCYEPSPRLQTPTTELFSWGWMTQERSKDSDSTFVKKIDSSEKYVNFRAPASSRIRLLKSRL
jgi:hypothetical protein